jgi:hypothetical protein
MTLSVAGRKICPACLLRLAAVIVVLSAVWNRHRRKAAALVLEVGKEVVPGVGGLAAARGQADEHGLAVSG